MSEADPQPPADHRPSAGPAPVGFGRILVYFLKLGAIGFEGPIATVSYMQRDLVEQRQWMNRQDFLDGVALGQTMPGPLAAQVAMWVGYLRRGAFASATRGLALHLSFWWPDSSLAGQSRRARFRGLVQITLD